jgi:nicotinamidase-related amidase
VDTCLEPRAPGRSVVELLQPKPEDYFVLKPRHSGFYSTSLEFLLEDLGADRLILTGIATDICVLVTANDAYVRGFQIVVPRDCVAANTPRKTAMALEQMRDVLKGDTRVSTSIALHRQRSRD